MPTFITKELLLIIEIALVLIYFTSYVSSITTKVLLVFLIPIMLYVFIVGNLVSNDTVKYYIPFYDESTWRTFEPGYTLLNEFFRSMSFTAEGFISLLITYFFIIKTISFYKISGNVRDFSFSLVIMFSGISYLILIFGVFRQFIAFSLVTFSVYLFAMQKKKFSLISILCAVSIHFSSVIYLLLPLFVKVEKKWGLRIILFSVILALSSSKLISLMLVVFSIIGDNFIVDSILRGVEYSNINDLHSTYYIKYLISACVVFSTKFLIERYVRDDISEKRSHVILSLNSIITLTFLIASLAFFSKEASIRMLYNLNIWTALLVGIMLGSIRLRKRFIADIIIMLMMVGYSTLSHHWMEKYINRFF
ncbi:EpsG family protein [Vibrio splendidus]